jgi:integrase
MARRRYQRGRLVYDAKTGKAWGRWREDVVNPQTGEIKRREPKKFLGIFKTKRLAQRELDQQVALADINNPNYRPRMDAGFKEFAERWQKDVLTQHAKSTSSADKSRLKKHILPFFSRYAVREITAFEVQSFIASSRLGVKSKRNCIALLRMMHKTAKAWRLTNLDWFDGLIVPEYTRPDSPFYTVDEMVRIISAANEPHRTFYWLMAETGIRLGEACGLRVKYLYFDVNVIVIRESAWLSYIGPTKSRKPRIFDISPELAARLKMFVEGMAPDDFIFATKGGKPWNGNDLVKDFLKPLLKDLSIKKPFADGKRSAATHAFRHGNSTILDKLKTPLRVRQERLGHKLGSDITLDVYTHAESEDHRSVAAQLGKMFQPGICALVAPKQENGSGADTPKPLVN